MHQKFAFAILGFTLVIAVFGIGILTKDPTIAGAAIKGNPYTERRPICPTNYEDVQLRKEIIPPHCFPGYFADGSESKYFMCCNMFYTQQYSVNAQSPGKYYQPKRAPVGKYY